jgi:uncharacterized protein YjbI with pentapeptide repeats
MSQLNYVHQTISDEYFIYKNLQGSIIDKSEIQKCDFSYSDLSSSNISSSRFTDSFFICTKMHRINILQVGFVNCNMRKVKMIEGVLEAEISSSVLDNVEFSNTLIQNSKILPNSSLRDIKLNDCDIQRCNFSGCKLINANLQSTKFTDTNLSEINLIGANLRNSKFFHTDIQNSNLTGADLRDADLSGFGGVDSDNYVVPGARLRGANLSKADLRGVTFVGPNFMGSDFHSVNLSGAKLMGVNLQGVSLTSVNLSNADLTGANLTDATLKQCNLTGANLTGANLTDAKLTSSSTVNATMTGANLTRLTVVEEEEEYDNYIPESDDDEKQSIPNNISDSQAQLERIQVNESKLPSTCYDFIMQDDLDINEQTSENEGFFILVFPSDKDEFNVICKTKEEIKMSLNDGSSIFYECTGRFKRDTLPDGTVVDLPDRIVGPINETPYVKVLGAGGHNIFIDVTEINTLLSSSERVYYVYPVREITHSISWNNIYGKHPNYVSAYHCQDGSKLSVYTLKVCEGDCIISNKFR